MNRIVTAYTTFRETGSADSYPFRVHPLAIIPRPVQSPGHFKAEFMEIVTDLWNRLKKSRSRRIRLQLNFVQLSACILAVRISNDYDRPRLKKKISVERKRATKRVIASLEREIKRARRAYTALLGEDVYKIMHEMWFQHLSWTRMHLVYYREPSLKTQRRRAQKLLIDECCQSARKGLLDKNLKPPESRDLRHLVRLAIRYIRRGRIRLFLQNLITNPSFAARFFAIFIEDRRELEELQPALPN